VENQKWLHKFELKPGRWVFVPTPETVAAGKKIKEDISKLWHPPSFYYHMQKGGHVSALRAHINNENFMHFDIKNFFGKINRTYAANRAKLNFNEEKEQPPANQVSSFNVSLSKNKIAIEDLRMKKFSTALNKPISIRQRAGILNYVGCINNEQRRIVEER
jgi:hypothetical protein